mmetsp:Transcript_62119/g.74739  ORF Transcript_62119/g.74739 Transcript_62119/m.74739 type:complete len:300 (+) Transcript_62119:187-1086(+)
MLRLYLIALAVLETSSFSTNRITSLSFTSTHAARTERNYGYRGRSISAHDTDEAEESEQHSRRRFVTNAAGIAAATLLHPSMARSDEDLSATLYNEDGTSKIIIEEAAFRPITLQFPSLTPGVDRRESVDGNAPPSEGDEPSMKLITYDLPTKWKDGYIDTTNNANIKVCDKITVYRTSKLLKGLKTLDKATNIGIDKALSIDLGKYPAIEKADLVSGKKRTGEGNTVFYEFDLAVAPATCKESGDNLGMGFCPYTNIVLLSAAIVDNEMYVLQLECDKNEWKEANVDLKRIRSSFAIS